MPRPELRYTRQATADLDEIDFYTQLNWGADQADGYLHDLAQTIERILDNPGLGRAHEEAGHGIRTMRSREHRIHYVVEDEKLILLRIEGPGQALGPDEISGLIE